MKFSEYYKYSWFSNMAYVVWEENDVSPDGAIRAATEQSRAPTALAEKIFRPNELGWAVPASGIYKNDDVGFSANLFVNGTEKILAIRGTELDVGDQKLADLYRASLLEIGILGLALSQTVSMFNYISRLTQSVGSEVAQVRLETSLVAPPPSKNVISFSRDGKTQYYWLEFDHLAQGLGLIGAGDEVTVTGHSLGGHLAAIALRMFPTLMDNAVTFNAPGRDPASATIFGDTIAEYLAALSPVSPAYLAVDAFGAMPQQLTDEAITGLFNSYLPARNSAE